MPMYWCMNLVPTNIYFLVWILTMCLVYEAICMKLHTQMSSVLCHEVCKQATLNVGHKEDIWILIYSPSYCHVIMFYICPDINSCFCNRKHSVLTCIYVDFRHQFNVHDDLLILQLGYGIRRNMLWVCTMLNQLEVDYVK